MLDAGLPAPVWYSHMYMTIPKTISAAEFKARCLGLMENVAREGTSITITKRGKPIARLVPAETEHEPFLGSLRGLATYTGDLTEPTGEIWEAEVGN